MGTGKKIYAEEKPTEVPLYNIHTHTCSQSTLWFLILKSQGSLTFRVDEYSMHISCFNCCTLLRLDLASWDCFNNEISSFRPLVISFSSSLYFLFKSWNEERNMHCLHMHPSRSYINFNIQLCYKFSLLFYMTIDKKPNTFLPLIHITINIYTQNNICLCKTHFTVYSSICFTFAATCLKLNKPSI